MPVGLAAPRGDHSTPIHVVSLCSPQQVAAEEKRTAQAAENLEKTKAMNTRVEEAQRKREEKEAEAKAQLDTKVEYKEAKTSAAEERRQKQLEDAATKAGAEVAKVRACRSRYMFCQV